MATEAQLIKFPRRRRAHGGFTQVPNDLIAACMSKHFRGPKGVLLLAVCRLTLGWGKDRERLTLAQLAEEADMKESQVSAVLKQLEEMGALEVIYTRQGRVLGLIENYAELLDKLDSREECRPSLSVKSEECRPSLSVNPEVNSPLSPSYIDKESKKYNHPKPFLAEGLEIIERASQAKAYPDDAGALHREIEQALKAEGMMVEREAGVSDRGDGRKGRIDLLATWQGVRFGIEIDNKRPRQKSIQKLQCAEVDATVIILRGGDASPVDGITLVCAASIEQNDTPRKTSLPPSFQITDALREWAAEKVPGVDLAFETEQFIDYHIARASKFTDWGRAWQTWMRNAQKWSRKPQAKAGFDWREVDC